MNLVRRTNSPLSAYRPHSVEDQFGRLVENMFEDMLAPFTSGGSLSRFSEDGSISPRLNVVETEKSYEIEAELPGVKKEDVKVAIENQRVTIEGEARREEQQREGENLLYTERSARKFVRSFMLPSEVDDANAQARMENGVLTLSLPKKQASAAKRLTVQ
jgi:HSP20 family protein